jgi:hypothetical protein
MDLATDFFRWLMPRIDDVWDDPDIQLDINERILSIHDGLTWEVGPDISKPQFFAISPNTDPELLPITVALMRAAPEHPEWAFYAARPRKLWDQRLIEARIGDDIVRVDFNNWTFSLGVVDGDETRQFTLTLHPDGDDDLPDAVVQGFAEMFVLFEIGEMAFIELITEVQVARTKPSNAALVTQLWDHLQSLRSP